MELKYFKTRISGDCYVPDDDFCNVISISEKYLNIIAFDDSPLVGVYCPLNITNTQYHKLREFTLNNNREEVTSLLKKIHNRNKVSLESGVLSIQPITNSFFDGDYLRLHKEFEDKEPILE